MNSRKKRFWKIWEKKNRELAEIDVKEANRRIEERWLRYLGNYNYSDVMDEMP